jgi:hypothetical protein
MRDRPLPAKDRAIVVMLLCFSLFAVTLDLYFVVNARVLESRVGHDWVADLWGIYADVDRTWIVSPWSLAQEGLNVFVTTLLNVWLMFAIVRGTAYRHALQLTLGSYLSYSVVLYYLAGPLSGYVGMRYRSFYTFAMFYGTALPWLLGHLYMAYDSFVAITRRFAGTVADG